MQHNSIIPHALYKIEKLVDRIMRSIFRGSCDSISKRAYLGIYMDDVIDAYIRECLRTTIFATL